MRTPRPPKGQMRKGAQIPKHLLRCLYGIDIAKTFLQMEGGISVETERIMFAFDGAVLPLSNEDLQRLPEGTSTINSQKIYTNGEALTPGQLVKDSLDGQIYTVTTELTHNTIHGMKRYVVTRRSVSANGR